MSLSPVNIQITLVFDRSAIEGNGRNNFMTASIIRKGRRGELVRGNVNKKKWKWFVRLGLLHYRNYKFWIFVSHFSDWRDNRDYYFRFGLVAKLLITMGVPYLFEVVSSFYDFKMNSVTRIIEIAWDLINCLQGKFLFRFFQNSTTIIYEQERNETSWLIHIFVSNKYLHTNI